MRIGSLFSGVGGFDLGLEWAGMEVAWQVEIDGQCQSVLRRHWPGVDLYEDVKDVGGTNNARLASERGERRLVSRQGAAVGRRPAGPESDAIEDESPGGDSVSREGGSSGSANLAPVDLICGGFPCQDLSVAGRRAGLAGDRSGLWHEFRRVVGEVAPRWVLIENVPGLLSSNGGRDMAVLVRGLEELGYWWAYRILDSQYFGVPQRRRRVFIVGCTRAAGPAEVLFEPEGVPWNPPPERTAGKAAPTLFGSGAGTSRTASAGSESEFVMLATDQANAEGVLAGPIYAIQERACSENLENGPGGGGIRDDGVAYTLEARHHTQGVVPFDTTQITSEGNYSRPKPGDPCHPLAAGAHAPAMAFEPRYYTRGQGGAKGSEVAGALQADAYGSSDKAPHVFQQNQRNEVRTMEVAGALQSEAGMKQQNYLTTAIPRRLTPRECERLQGFPDDWTRWADDGSEISDSARYRMMGNAVTVPVAHWIGQRLAATYGEGEEE